MFVTCYTFVSVSLLMRLHMCHSWNPKCKVTDTLCALLT